MESKRSYIVSFGDSTRYRVAYDGSKEEFEASEKLRDIKNKVFDFLKEKFPTGGYEDAVKISVADDDGRSFPDLDNAGCDELLKSVARQVEVLREGKELNNNAPFDRI